MNLENIKLEELNTQEQHCIEGGSELTDAIWYGIGYVAGSIYHFSTHRMHHISTIADK